MENLLNQKQFDNLKLELNEFRIRDINELKEKQKEINVFYPCEILYTINENNNFEYAFIYLKHDKHKIRVTEYKKQFSIFNIDIWEFRNFTSYQQNEIIEKTNLIKPKNIGKLSTKKITEWVNYNEKVYEVLKNETNKTNDKIKEFKETLKPYTVTYTNEKETKGYIIKNGLQLSFEIGETGNIYNKITVATKESVNLDIFKLLSDNQYK